MDQPEGGTEQAMRLRIAFLHWAACLATFVVFVAIAFSFNSGLFGNLAFLTYIVSGIYLSRAVLRRIIEWHPVYDTLYNVTSAKIRMLLFWPVSYLILFARLGINKVL